MKGLDGIITITTSEYRPCYVDGEKALFHKWETKEIPLLRVNALLTEKAIKRVMDKVKSGEIPNGGDVFIQKQTFAIVEYENGKVEEVEPIRVRFADNKIKEYAFYE